MYRLGHWKTCFFLIFFMTPMAEAQRNNLRFQSVANFDEISQKTINVIHQDKFGFLWFGTQDGLNRFDGYTFKQYKNKTSEPHSIPSNYIQTIYEDEQGDMWIGSFNSLIRFSRETEHFEMVDVTKPSQQTSNQIVSIQKGLNDLLWIGSDSSGLNIYDPKTGKLSQFGHEGPPGKKLSSARIADLESDDGKGLWIALEDTGLNHYDFEKDEFTYYHADPNDPNSIRSNQLSCLLKDSSGMLWIGNNEAGLDRFNPNTGEMRHFNMASSGLSDDRIRVLLEDFSGFIWVGTESGLNRLDPISGKVTHFSSDPRSDIDLAQIQTLSLFQDKTGILWIGAWSGMRFFDPNTEFFTHYRHMPDQKTSLGHNLIFSFEETEEGHFWVGTVVGADYFDPETETFRHYVHDPANPRGLSSDKVRSIKRDSKGRMWFGLFGGGINLYQKETDDFIHYRHDPGNPNSLSIDKVRDIDEDRDGILWISTEDGGLNRFDVERNQFKHYRSDPEDPTTIGSDKLSRMYQTQDGALWFGTLGAGVSLMNEAQTGFINYGVGNGPKFLSNGIIMDIFEDHNNQLWIGTMGGGLNLFQREQQTFKVYREEDGLPNNTIYGILEDLNGFLWLSTNRGLARFNPRTEKSHIYTEGDGLQGNEFNLGATYKTANGVFLFGGTYGFNMFRPGMLTNDPHAPTVAFTDFLIANKTVEPGAGGPIVKPMHLNPTIKLSYEDYLFSIDFTALHFANPKRNQYAYMLDGVDSEWISTDANHRRATYSNLTEGRYTFKVRAANRDGVWSKEDATLSIVVQGPPWLSLWAKIIYVMILVALIFFYLRHQRLGLIRERSRVQQEQQISARLRQIDKVKDEFLANTSHELRTPLNGIIGLTESLLDGAAGQLDEQVHENLALVAASGRRLSALVNDLLDFSKLKNHNLELNLRPVDLQAMTEIVLSLSRPLISGKSLLVENEVSPDLPPVLADEDRLQQILLNLVGNAIKFTEQGTVKVTAEQSHTIVLIHVTDTGIGIAKEQHQRIFESFEQVDGTEERSSSGTGLGLAITKKLVLLHGGNITVESKAGMGSKFTFSLPIADGAVESLQRTALGAITQTRATLATKSEWKPIHEAEKPHLLIVDDEPVNRQVLINHLGTLYNLTVACDGFEALQCIKENAYDLVLLDVMMPKMSGYEVCRRIRDTYSAHELPVIYLSARNQSSDLVASFKMGGNDYLVKPVSKDELLARVDTHLNLLNVNRNLDEMVQERTKQLLVSEKMASIGLLTSGVAHEINNPNNYITNGIELMRKDLRSFHKVLLGMAGDDAEAEILEMIGEYFEDFQQHIQSMENGTKKIETIIRDLYLFSRLNQAERKRVDLVENIRATIHLIQSQFGEHVTLETHFEESLMLDCWASELNQVFMSLLINAHESIIRRFGKKSTEGVISISVERRSGNAVIKIKDNGTGVDRDIKDKIFEAFFTTKDIGKGSGLGLYVCYNVITKHAGTIELVDEGAGACFVVCLPLNLVLTPSFS